MPKGERCEARGADISAVVARAQAIVAGRDPNVTRSEQLQAATLLVMLDIRTYLDRINTDTADISHNVGEIQVSVR